MVSAMLVVVRLTLEQGWVCLSSRESSGNISKIGSFLLSICQNGYFSLMIAKFGGRGRFLWSSSWEPSRTSGGKTHGSVVASLKLLPEVFNFKLVHTQLLGKPLKCSYLLLAPAASAPGKLLCILCISLSLQVLGWSFILWPRFPDESKKSPWFSVFKAFFFFLWWRWQ